MKIEKLKTKNVNSLLWKDMAVKQLVWGVKRNWHEQSVLQSAIFTIVFFSFFSDSPLRPFLKEEVIRSKNLFCES